MNHRKEKRYEISAHGGHRAYNVYMAYIRGQCAALSRLPKGNPYPQGRRHDEWERGYDMEIGWKTASVKY